MSRSIIGLILIWMVSMPLKAAQPIFNISSLDATHGQIIDVDFHVDKFSNIISAQFSVNWDPAVLKFRTIKNLNAGVTGLNLSSSFNTMADHIDIGNFTMLWFESSVTPVTIPDGSLFYTVEFEVLGNPCDQSAVSITSNPVDIEVSEPNEVLVGLVSNNGGVNVPGTGCSQDIELNGNSVIGPCGENVCVQFTVQNFNDVGVMEFSMVFNSSVLQFDKVQSFAPLLGFGTGNVNLAAPDSLKVVWINNNVENQSLPDGTVFFEICFNVIGGGGQSSQITFGSNEVTFSDISDNHYEVDITPASVTAQCALEGFAFIADTICAQPNDVVCMDIKVNDFDDIIAFQYAMNWDSTKFVFDHVGCFGLPGISDGFGTPLDAGVKEGQLLVSWLDLSLQGESLPDDATIFCLCLKAIGPVNTSSPIIFSADGLDIEIVNVADSVLEYTLVQGIGNIKADCGPTPCTVSYTLIPTSPTCPGTSTGSLDLTVNLSAACNCTPTYLWSYQGATTQDLLNVPPGNYSVTITCNQVIIATATVADAPQMSVTSVITNPVPASACNGSINITVTGGTFPYTFLWSTTPPQTTEDISNLCAGSYTVTITDSKGCIFIPDPFIVGADISAVVTKVTCNGLCNGAISLADPTFGTAPYTYLWNTTPPQTTKNLFNLCAGTYCVTITDNTGSTRDSCFMVSQPNPIILSATVTNDNDMNCGGAIDLNVTGGTQPFSYLWTGPGAFTAITQDIIGLCVGQYCVTVTDGNGCTATGCYSVTAGGFGVDLNAQQHQGFQISCNGICDGLITSNASGGAAPYTYHWSRSNNDTGPTLTNVCAGTYGLTVTDANGQTATSSIVMNAPPPLNLNISTTDPSFPGATDGAASVIVTGGVPNYTYLWTGPVSGNTPALNNIPSGSYTILVSDANGCQETEIAYVGSTGPDCFKGMSVFTPNSDGKNDFFVITCVNEPNHLYIFNRNGGLVYETDNYQNNWIGVDKDDEPVPDGGYLWVLEVYGANGAIQLHKGTVVLLRTAD